MRLKWRERDRENRTFRETTYDVEGEGQHEEEEPDVHVRRVDEEREVRVVEPAARHRRPQALHEYLDQVSGHGTRVVRSLSFVVAWLCLIASVDPLPVNVCESALHFVSLV